ncbi:family 49 glycosyl hydrolase [Rarobacter incanus]|uniref:Glycosyl hydrolase family 49 n=1 Tax=Rarobacter incanus TaxID=153494 RepID=A0A542SQC1_9MICO|nr:family 49 glycosyl hydrolase [Rarobacter incanus]TQK76809.1 glycosyl hydrolase family 49 [Rarobacter incanus]
MHLRSTILRKGLPFAAALVLAIPLALVPPLAAPTPSAATSAGPAASATTTQSAATNRNLQASTAARESTPATSQSEGLVTWWHANGEKNSDTPVADGAVRQSPFYTVQVATDDAQDEWFDSFTYLTIPRSGKGKPGYGTATDGYQNDGAENAWEDAEAIAAEQGVEDGHQTMSWTTFEFSRDVWIDVALDTGATVSSIDQVQIKPRQLGFTRFLVNDHTVRIKIPYSPDGYRFSVEFSPELTQVSGPNRDYMNEAASTAIDASVAAMVEPRNAMMVFAEPDAQQDSGTVPTDADGTIYRPAQGSVTNLDTVDADIIYFEPGTYSMGAAYRAQLNPRVRWVYLAPGAYVKGAFDFSANASITNYKVTGFGVLSGEQYVYEADTRNDGYTRRDPAKYDNCHADCVKPLRFDSAQGVAQTLDLQGVTIAEPSYHSFVVYGDYDSFTMRVRNYHQVGAWYWQTDGLELYAGSTMKNSFLQANDDALKIYHSNVTIDNTVVWKGPNGPVIQWGWVPRNVSNVEISRTYVIHNQLQWDTINTCVLNSSRHWDFDGRNDRASTGATIRDIRIEDTYVEGATGCAFRIYALANTYNFVVKGLHVDGWAVPADSATNLDNQLYADYDADSGGAQVAIGQNSIGVSIQDFTVGNTYVSFAADNWHDSKLGRVSGWFPWGTWEIVRSASAPDQPFASSAVGGVDFPCEEAGANKDGLECPAPGDGGDGGDGGTTNPGDGGDGGDGGTTNPGDGGDGGDGGTTNPGDGGGTANPGDGGGTANPGDGSSRVMVATSAPRLQGTFRVGANVSATSGAWSQSGVTATYQWYVGNAAASGATGARYKIRTADVGKQIWVKVTARKSGFALARASSVKKTAAKAKVKVVVRKKAKRTGGKIRLRVAVTTAATGKPTGRLVVRVGRTVVRVKVRAKQRGKITVKLPGSVTKGMRVQATFKPSGKAKRYLLKAASKRARIS